MPIPIKRRIHPLSINSNVTIGMAFPIDEVNLFEGTKTVKDQIKTNLLNLLLTDQGERINHPNYGVGLKNLLFEQHVDEEELDETISQQIEFYIPEIQLTNTDVQFIEDENLLYISITYMFNLDQSEDTIQLNFK